MRALSLKTLTAVLVVAALAGCATKKTNDSAQTAAATAPTSTAAPAQTAPVDDGAVSGSNLDTAPVAGATTALSADGFENNAANYTGDVRTRVIYFAFDRAEVPTAAYASLKAHAKVLANNPAARLKLEGHADERGTPEYNVALAERRAKSVQKFLVLNGAKDSQISVVSFGEEKPADLGHDELAWAKNRRVELVYTAGQP